MSKAEARIDALSDFGAAQELADHDEAARLGVARFMKDSTAYFGDERKHVMAAIVRESRRNGLDPLLVAAVIQVESRFDPFAVSGVGACGLMQLMPPNRAGSSGEGLTQALIAYNAGPTVARSLRRGSPAWRRLHAYPRAVLAAYKALLMPLEQVAAR